MLNIVMQGKIIPETPKIIKEYLDNLPFVSRIIVSTSENDKNEKLIPLNSKVTKVTTKNPEDCGTGDRNLQIITSLAGLREVTSKVSVKVRSDQRYYKSSWFHMYDFWEKNIQDQDKIFILGLFKNFLFHPRDHLFWGKTEKLLEYFQLPLDQPSFQHQNNVKEEDLWKYYSQYSRTETYLGAHYASKYYPEVSKFLETPSEYLYDYADKINEARVVSDITNDALYKIFPMECSSMQSLGSGHHEKNYGEFNYPFKIQKETVGERWDTALGSEEEFLLKQYILSSGREVGSMMELANFYRGSNDFIEWAILNISLGKIEPISPVIQEMYNILYRTRTEQLDENDRVLNLFLKQVNRMPPSFPGVYGIFSNLFDTKKVSQEIITAPKPTEKKQNLINPKPQNVSWVVENFYQNPLEVRNIALKAEYDEGAFGELGRGYIGRRSKQKFFEKELKVAFEKIMNKKITDWKDQPSNARFQICYAGEPLVYHADSQQWAGLIYLTPEAPFNCGTTLYAQKETRIRNTKNQKIFEKWPKGQNLDKTTWEEVDVFGNIFNRLVIYEATNVHSASEYFGYDRDNARLWQMFFFNAE